MDSVGLTNRWNNKWKQMARQKQELSAVYCMNALYSNAGARQVLKKIRNLVSFVGLNQTLNNWNAQFTVFLNFNIIISSTSIFFKDESWVWAAASQQTVLDNQPPATLPFCDLPFSQSDASICEYAKKSCLGSCLSIILGDVRMIFYWSDTCPSSPNQLGSWKKCWIWQPLQWQLNSAWFIYSTNSI